MAFLKRLLAGVGAVALASGMLMIGSSATATAASCPADKVFAVGGFQDGEAKGFAARGYHVARYSGNLNAINEGVDSLKREVDAFRAQCRNSKVIVTGFSQGAAIAHVYLSRHGADIRNNGAAVLFADPKRPGGEADGLFALGGAPISGTDNNYGGVRTLQVCYLDDIICNRSAPSGWIGYFQGKHGNYNLDARALAGRTGEHLYW